MPASEKHCADMYLKAECASPCKLSRGLCRTVPANESDCRLRLPREAHVDSSWHLRVAQHSFAVPLLHACSMEVHLLEWRSPGRRACCPHGHKLQNVQPVPSACKHASREAKLEDEVSECHCTRSQAGACVHDNTLQQQIQQRQLENSTSLS